MFFFELSQDSLSLCLSQSHLIRFLSCLIRVFWIRYTHLLYCIVLYCVVLYCIVLCCIVLCCVVLCCVGTSYSFFFGFLDCKHTRVKKDITNMINTARRIQGTTIAYQRS